MRTRAAKRRGPIDHTAKAIECRVYARLSRGLTRRLFEGLAEIHEALAARQSKQPEPADKNEPATPAS